MISVEYEYLMVSFNFELIGRIPKKLDIYSFNVLYGNGDSQIGFEKF